MLNRRTSPKPKQRTWRSVLLRTSGVVGGLSVLAIARYFVLLQASELTHAHTHETALPWIETEAECRGEARVWDEGTCWDTQHDLSF